MTRENFLKNYQELSESEKQLFEKLFDESTHELGAKKSKKKQLVAYLSGANLDQTEIEEKIKKLLPTHMLPRHYVILPELPTLPNGKLDNGALKNYKIEQKKEPRKTEKLSPSAQTLIRIWQEVLQVDSIGLHDNFFEYGGDSILAIQIVSKARNEGINLSPSIFLEKQTVAEILKAEAFNEDSDVVLEKGKLTPIQSWFFNTLGNNPHWHLGLEIELVKDVEPFLEDALNHVLNTNTVLKSSFYLNDEANMRVNHEAKVIYKKIDFVKNEEDTSRLETSLCDLHKEMSLAEGKLVGALYINSATPKLYLSFHHLVVDPVSLMLVFEELGQAISLLKTDKKLQHSPAGSKHYYQIGEALANLPVQEELPFWQSQCEATEMLPINSDEKFVEGDVKHANFYLTKEITESMLKLVKETEWLNFEALFTATISQALCTWAEQTQLIIGLEKSIRNLPIQNIQNTIGWMTSFFPLKIEANMNDVHETLVYVLEKQKTIINSGIGYGLLRYNQKEESLETDPQVIINYLGTEPTYNNKHLGVGRFLRKGMRRLDSEFNHLLEFNILLEENKLCLSYSYVSTKVSTTDIEFVINETSRLLGLLVEDRGKRLHEVYSQKKLNDIGLDSDDFDELLNQF